MGAGREREREREGRERERVRKREMERERESEINKERERDSQRERDSLNECMSRGGNGNPRNIAVGNPRVVDNSDVSISDYAGYAITSGQGT